MNKYKLESRLRNVGLAYVLFFIAGAHYAYLNKWGTQILFWLTFGGLGIWWFIDIFRIPGLVNKYNDPIFDEIDWLEEQEEELRRYENRKRREEQSKVAETLILRDQEDFLLRPRKRRERDGNLFEEQWRKAY